MKNITKETKKLKKTSFKRLLAVMLSVVTVLSSSLTVCAASDNTNDGYVVYMPFGDSITEANPGYVKYVSDGIDAFYTMNGGISGATSTNWVNAMKTNIYIKDTMKQADVTTITLGSNDIWFRLIEIVADTFGCEPSMEAINSYLENAQKQYNNASGINKLYLGLQMIYKANTIHSNIYSDSVINTEAKKYKQNMETIVTNLKSYNPNMEIYIGNLYNPYINTSPMQIAGYTVFDLDELVEKWETAFNKELATLNGKVTVVNLHNVITSESQLIGDLGNGNYDPHPNNKGHKDIANAFMNAMK